MAAKISNKLTMNREGTFRFKAVGPNHCGVDENLQVNYRMVCECYATLDRRGFLFDQINVDNYFQSIQSSVLSCEKLTIKCAQKLLKMIKKENAICAIRSMSLTLSPAPFKASMTYDWVNDEEPIIKKGRRR